MWVIMSVNRDTRSGWWCVVFVRCIEEIGPIARNQIVNRILIHVAIWDALFVILDAQPDVLESQHWKPLQRLYRGVHLC
jgi:hypothetical protein